MNVGEAAALYRRLQMKYTERDDAMRKVWDVRDGNMKHVFPDLFPDDGPVDSPIVANMVDIAARDTAEVLAPLPSFNCAAGTSTSDTARKFAEKRTRIANNYIAHCRAQRQMYTAADRYVSYGFVSAIVEVDTENKMPYVRFLDPMGTYTLRDRFDRIVKFFQSTWHDPDELCAQYPLLASAIKDHRIPGIQKVEVVRYHDKTVDMLFMPAKQGLLLESKPNPVGEVLVVEARRPGLKDDPRGQFDDVLAVQVAKSRLAFLALEAAEKAVKAPMALPNDVMEYAVGPDATLRSATPEKIRRVPLEVPRDAFAEQAALDQELRSGSRYPDARNGQVEGSIVTGRGVQALMSGFDTQIRTGQAIFAEVWTRLVELCFKMDEAIWSNLKRTVRGTDNGTPFEITYTPSKDISGDHTVDVQYGLMAGLEPNRALVFLLQARGDKLVSRDFGRRQMPFSLNPVEEEQKVDAEELRDALKQAIAGYAQAIPILAQNGQDPGEILSRLAMIIEGRQKGKPIESLVTEAFAPQAPPPGVESPDASATPVPGDPGQAPPGGGGMEGLDAMGRVRGVAPGQAGMAPGGRPDMNVLLAGLTQRGEPSLQAGVSRRMPI